MIEFNKSEHKIAIIAPASGCKDKEESFERLQQAVSFFTKHGFECSYDEQIFAGDKLEYFAAPRVERRRQLQDALLDPEVRIIWAFRGGYGCSNIVFDFMEVVPSGPKILVGFSDITALHMLFNKYYKFPSIHGSMNAQKSRALEEVLSVIAGNNVDIELKSLNSVKSDSLRGKMLGGNLTVLCNMIGTKLQPATEGKILFLEDVNEKGYQVHRHLVHMYNAGLLKQIKALVFGEFTNSDQYIEQSITSFAEEYLFNIPVYTTNEFGHGDINHPITIGGAGKITNNILTIASPFQLI